MPGLADTSRHHCLNDAASPVAGFVLAHHLHRADILLDWIGNFMIQTASEQAILFGLISICLGACLVWALWEIEAARERRQRHHEFIRQARRSVTPGR
ncbi:hypothetical protein [Bradyrhizobium sp.]|uniref:hypothetical protein n=1 Tax=Bradyrhizobium sp. TaxID=376 RepID=UPI0039E2ECB9